MIWRCFEYGPPFIWVLMLVTVVRPLRLGLGGRITLMAGLLLATQKFLIYRFLGGNPFVPELPESVIHVTGWLYSAAMFWFGLSCLWALAKRLPRVRQAGRDRSVLIAMAVIAAVTAGWGLREGRKIPNVRRVAIAVEGLPKEFEGFRIVQLSDLHCCSAARRARTEGIVARVNSLRPDLVCITGDIVDGSPERRAEDLAPLAGLRAPFGIFGCPGNHEYFYSYCRWREIYESLGVTMLDNAHRMVEKAGARLALGGVTDPVAARYREREELTPTNSTWFAMTDVERAFAGVPPGVCRILLQHRPLSPKFNEEHDVRLQLSGHTHGGAILGVDLLVAWLGNDGYLRGLYQVGRMALYINPGTGQWAGFPLRLGVPSEITEIILSSRQHGGL